MLKLSLNVQKNSQIFTLVTRNTKQEESVTNYFQKQLEKSSKLKKVEFN